jgi:hypothetical protein
MMAAMGAFERFCKTLSLLAMLGAGLGCVTSTVVMRPQVTSDEKAPVTVGGGAIGGGGRLAAQAGGAFNFNYEFSHGASFTAFALQNSIYFYPDDVRGGLWDHQTRMGAGVRYHLEVFKDMEFGGEIGAIHLTNLGPLGRENMVGAYLGLPLRQELASGVYVTLHPTAAFLLAYDSERPDRPVLFWFPDMPLGFSWEPFPGLVLFAEVAYSATLAGGAIGLGAQGSF